MNSLNHNITLDLAPVLRKAAKKQRADVYLKVHKFKYLSKGLQKVEYLDQLQDGKSGDS